MASLPATFNPMLDVPRALQRMWKRQLLESKIGPLYAGRAPEKAQFPYAVYNLIGSSPKERTASEDGGTTYSETRFQISFYGITDEIVGVSGAIANEHLDSAELDIHPVTDGSIYYCTQTGSTIEQEDVDAWRCRITYSVLASQSRKLKNRVVQ